MHALVDIHSPFHIDFGWWESRRRNLGRFLAEILGEDEVGELGEAPLDVIDPTTAEVVVIDPLWARVINERAHRPSYITATTPLANAVLRALVENLNRPMTAVELHRRINRASPDVILRVLRSARVQYGIVPLVIETDAASAKATVKSAASAKASPKAAADGANAQPTAAKAPAKKSAAKAPAKKSAAKA